MDGTIIVISGQNKAAPKIKDISELFPACFKHLEYTLIKYYGLISSNYEFSLETKKPVTIGDYQMHTFVGSFEFDYDAIKGSPEHRKYQFVAYATTLKSNGGYAYWVVYDNTEEQSKGQLINEYAYNMAKTFKEEE